MKTKNIVIYRYHHKFDLVKERIKFIRLLDPEIKVYGIFGGELSEYSNASNILEHVLDGNYLIKSENSRWKWLHADITYKMWYNDYGKNIEFDFAFIMEWDLLVLNKLENAFPPLNQYSMYCTGLIPYEKISKYWFWADKTNGPKVRAFFNKVREIYKMDFNEYATLGPGLCAPRMFFEGLLDLKLFEADVTDEVKIPVWGQLIGLNPVNNNFYNKWFSYFEMKHFNANIYNITTTSVLEESLKKHGRCVFHPYRENILSSELFGIYERSLSLFGEKKEIASKNVTTANLLEYKIGCKLLKNK